MPAPKRAMKPQARTMVPAVPSTTTRPTTTSTAASMSHGHAEFLRTVTATSRLVRQLARGGQLAPTVYLPTCGCNRELLRSTCDSEDGGTRDTVSRARRQRDASVGDSAR